MLATHITEALHSAFPEVAFVLSCPPGPVATLDGPCAELSPLQIFDDGDEATIYLGTITHGHLGCYDEGISEDKRHKQIADDVIDFVRDLFQIVSWRVLRLEAGSEAGDGCLRKMPHLDPVS